MKDKTIKRCAIYTRKSNEDGLEQEYNTLEAQRDMAVNFIRSQAEQKWTVVPEHYDDGGISGGTMERPELKKLLKDIKAGKIDVVVVYKIDRLSRSLYDFLGMIRLFDEHDVIFVSVTQNINSGTPMVTLLQEMMPELNLEQQRNATVGSPVTLEIPISMNKKGARKFIKAPNGTDIVSTRLPKYDDTLIKAVIRAHDWQGRIESGLVASVAELALKEGIGENYVGKIIRLTELAPDITMAILNGRQPPSMTLSQMEDVPLLWEEQRQAFGFAGQ